MRRWDCLIILGHFILPFVIIFIFKQKLRLLEEIEDTWLPYLTPKDDEFNQQVCFFNVFIHLK